MLMLSLQLLHLTSLAYLHSARRHILFSAIYLHLPIVFDNFDIDVKLSVI